MRLDAAFCLDRVQRCCVVDAASDVEVIVIARGGGSKTELDAFNDWDLAQAIAAAGCRPAEIAACGIACQRNTDFVWDARTGQPLTNAISWQDLRTGPMLAELARGAEEAAPALEEACRFLLLADQVKLQISLDVENGTTEIFKNVLR